MKIFDRLFKKEDFTEEDYATADESQLVGDDY
jgi:hypothetical protein